MPTHTPSPHRFLAPHPPSTQKSKPKPQSNLRHGFAASTPKCTVRDPHTRIDDGSEVGKVTPARRFVFAPAKRGVELGTNTAIATTVAHKGQEGLDEGSSYTPTTSRPKPKRTFRRVESIHESSQESPSGTPQNTQTLQSVERNTFSEDDEDGRRDEEEQDEDEDEDAEMLFTPAVNPNKRRRLSLPSSSPPQTYQNQDLGSRPPQTPAQPAHSNLISAATHTPAPTTSSHRFLIPAPRTPALFHPSTPNANPTTTTATPSTQPQRPHFLLPRHPPSPLKSTTPLPETFSPSRKTHKHIPNGLASTLQGWMIETANTGFAAMTREAVVWGGREKEEGVRVRLVVGGVRGARVGGAQDRGNEDEGGQGGKGKGKEVDCYAGSVTFVCGTLDANTSRIPGASHDGEVKMLLAGQGGARGTGGVRIKQGSVVGVRAPMWDIDMEGEKWVVSVDWVVL